MHNPICVCMCVLIAIAGLGARLRPNRLEYVGYHIHHVSRIYQDRTIMHTLRNNYIQPSRYKMLYAIKVMPMPTRMPICTYTNMRDVHTNMWLCIITESPNMPYTITRFSVLCTYIYVHSQIWRHMQIHVCMCLYLYSSVYDVCFRIELYMNMYIDQYISTQVCTNVRL